MQLSKIFIALSWLASASAVDQVVHLDYATYKGQVVGNGIMKWLGMRYAAPPLGALRFSAPRDPPVLPGIQNADHVCPPTNVTVVNCTDHGTAWQDMSSHK
jgi:carboxylesterase type B